MKMPSIRMTYFISTLLIAGLIAISFYLQKYDGVVPCPLCLLQRIDFALLGIIFFFGATGPAKKLFCWFIGSLASIFTIIGILLAGRQVWLQHLPPNQNADCGVSLQYLMNVLPLDQAFTKVLQGSAECSVKGWEFLTFSLAEWSLLFFVLFCLLSVFQILRNPSN